MSQYACHNKPRPTSGGTYPARSGYRDYWHPEYEAVVREVKWIAIPNVLSADCQYTQRHASDPQCGGCVHQTKG